MLSKDTSEIFTYDDDFVREGEKKSGSYLKTATVLALGGMAAVVGTMSNSDAIQLQKEDPSFMMSERPV